ncbi:MAG: hypothetical protein A2Y20_07750 [Firmicutes bacterium GWF2_51_9]|nr:MAG: hypothetical protein A2Y20_07750 [Firmicutes bacterium GWF2_51_9]OGS58488.1 MAG: hypothetical protein A2Y19_00600 [Firmicutes bacterium GWE2_51_13]HAM62639.1 hypothetical protein [Erysipelotrichaceae bacterium]
MEDYAEITKFCCYLDEPIHLFDGYFFDNLHDIKDIKKFAKLLKKFDQDWIKNHKVSFLESPNPNTIPSLLLSLDTKCNKSGFCLKNHEVFEDCYMQLASSVVMLICTKRIEKKISDEFRILWSSKNNEDIVARSSEIEAKYHSAAATLDTEITNVKNAIDLVVRIAVWDYLDIQIGRSIFFEYPIEHYFRKFEQITWNEYDCLKSNLIYILHDDVGPIFFGDLFKICEPNLNLIRKHTKYREKLDYLSEIFAYSRKYLDDRMIVVSLVSILEILIAHKPNANKFNVEDSIAKQFSKNTLLALYLSDNKIDYISVEKELNLMYSLRSHITHGDFENMGGTLDKIHNQYLSNDEYVDRLRDGEEIAFEFVLERLWNITMTVIERFINEPIFFDVLKLGETEDQNKRKGKKTIRSYRSIRR